MSPTAPTFVTLNDQLNKAHRRIRELEARETELFADNRTLRAAITELTDADHHVRPPVSPHRPTMPVTDWASAISAASTHTRASCLGRSHRNPW